MHMHAYIHTYTHTYIYTQTVVIGLTPALTAVELLEKRVRSRFSGRQIFFMDPILPEQVNVRSSLKRSNLTSFLYTISSGVTGLCLGLPEFCLFLMQALQILTSALTIPSEETDKEDAHMRAYCELHNKRVSFIVC